MSRFKALKADKGGEFWGKDNPRCPCCGNEINVNDNELWYLYEDETHEVSCPACNEDFKVITNVSYSFSTNEQDENEDEDEDEEVKQ